MSHDHEDPAGNITPEERENARFTVAFRMIYLRDPRDGDTLDSRKVDWVFAGMRAQTVERLIRSSVTEGRARLRAQQ